MRFLTILLITGFVFSSSQAFSFSDTLKKFGDDLKAKFAAIGSDLKEVGGALGTVAKAKAASLGSQTLQAIVGAFLNSFKGFSLGKRDLGSIQSEVATVENYIAQLIESTQKTLGEIFRKTFSRFGTVFDSLVQLRPEEDVQSQVEQIHAEHQFAVRGILGDALNVGIDTIKKLWYKFKDTISGGPLDVLDPIMVRRSGLIEEAWNHFVGKLDNLKEKIVPHYEKATEITKNVAAVLGHYGGKMVQQAKEKAVGKMHETLGYLADRLNHHLSNAKSKFESFKQELSTTVHDLMHSE